MAAIRLTVGSVSGEPSLLELLHPAGRCLRTLLVGSGCPARLRPDDSPRGGELDLVVVAPDANETRDTGWLDHTVFGTAARLARDGLLCALAPPRHRSRLVRLLGASGL